MGTPVQDQQKGPCEGEEKGKNADVMGGAGEDQTPVGLVNHGENCGSFLKCDGGHGWAQNRVVRGPDADGAQTTLTAAGMQ